MRAHSRQKVASVAALGNVPPFSGWNCSDSRIGSDRAINGHEHYNGLDMTSGFWRVTPCHFTNDPSPAVTQASSCWPHQGTPRSEQISSSARRMLSETRRYRQANLCSGVRGRRRPNLFRGLLCFTALTSREPDPVTERAARQAKLLVRSTTTTASGRVAPS